MIKLLFEQPDIYAIWVLLVAFSICCHEYMHARAALWQGDSTAADLGHLTLNPFRQMGVFSIIMLLVVGISWGATPVNPSRMRHSYSNALVSFAGPCTNLVLFLIFCMGAGYMNAKYGIKGIASVKESASMLQGASLFFLLGAVLNIVLFLFNMLPVPPFDGYSVISYFFPGLYNVNPEFKNGVIFLIVILVFYFFEWLYMIGGMIAGIVIGVMSLFFQVVL